MCVSRVKLVLGQGTSVQLLLWLCSEGGLMWGRWMSVVWTRRYIDSSIPLIWGGMWMHGHWPPLKSQLSAAVWHLCVARLNALMHIYIRCKCRGFLVVGVFWMWGCGGQLSKIWHEKRDGISVAWSCSPAVVVSTFHVLCVIMSQASKPGLNK